MVGKKIFGQQRVGVLNEKKIVGALQINKKGAIVHCQLKHIQNYSSKELSKVFKSHISTEAVVITEKWIGFQPLAKEYSIQRRSGTFRNFIQTNRLIHHLKTWLRSTYTWMHEHHMQRYLDEFSFRTNRSIHKDNIFDALILRMISTEPLRYMDIKIRT